MIYNCRIHLTTEPFFLLLEHLTDFIVYGKHMQFNTLRRTLPTLLETFNIHEHLCFGPMLLPFACASLLPLRERSGLEQW